MQKRQLGRNGPQVSAMGLGCMSFAGFYGPTDEATSMRCMARAVELGVDFFDTADVYGLGTNEDIVGRFLKTLPPSRRVVLATKGANLRIIGRDREFDNSPAYMASALEASLKRLGLERVDLYYIHRRQKELPIEEAIEGMAKLVRQGKIGGIGLSEVAPDTIRRAHAVHPIAAVQSEYSPWTRGPELGVLQTCRELGIAFVPFGATGRAFLAGHMKPDTVLGEKDFRRGNPRFTGVNYARNLAAFEPFKAHAAEKGVKPVQLVLAWSLAKWDHVIHIPGTRTAEHIEDNVAAARMTLSAADMADIERLLPPGFAAGDRYPDAGYAGVERYG